MYRLGATVVLSFLLGATGLFADDLWFGYDGDISPLDPSAGFTANPCTPPCVESLQSGYLVNSWGIGGDRVTYSRRLVPFGDSQPPTLWMEWRLRSTESLGSFLFCDARFYWSYKSIHDGLQHFGDAAVSFDGESFVLGLDDTSFHLFRFESLDGFNYTVSIDGTIFLTAIDSELSAPFLSFGGDGGCDANPTVNEWDFVRYGTISYGEAVVDSDPLVGDVSAIDYPDRTRFTVTFDSPNYVYVDDISVSVTDFPGVTPVAPMNRPMVLQTRRLDNGPPEVVEIVLDKPIPHAATTTFTLTDGTAVNIIEYTLSPGDADGDGRATLADFAHLQNCFRPGSPSAFCKTFDLNRNNQLTLTDHQLYEAFLVNP